MKIFEVLEKLDRRIIFIFIALAVIVPFFIPLNFDFSVSPPVQSFYDAIESIPQGSRVLLSIDYDPSSMPELYPMHVAVLKQLFSRNLKVICMQLWATGSPLAERVFSEIAVKEFDKKNGIDYVNLGFKEGREMVMASMGESIPKTFPTDYHGTKVGDIPIMQGVHNFSDLAMIVNISAGVPGTKEWVLQVQSRFHIKLVSGTTAVSVPEFYPYLQSGQLAGLLGGMKGAAEYEKLVGVKGLGRKGMDSQSVSHVVIFLFILIGNIAYFSTRGKKKK